MVVKHDDGGRSGKCFDADPETIFLHHNTHVSKFSVAFAFLVHNLSDILIVVLVLHLGM